MSGTLLIVWFQIVDSISTDFAFKIGNMLARSGGIPRSWSFKPEKLGQDAIRVIGNLFFAIFVLGVIVFTIIVATYQPEDPLLHPSVKITNFLTSNSNATFTSDGSEVRTGEDFIAPTTDSISSVPFINVTDVDSVVPGEDGVNEEVIKEVDGCDVDKPIECNVPEVHHLLMRTAIETYTDIHFYRFGKPFRGSNDTSCDIAWRFRPMNAKRAAFYKDYRRFVVLRNANCSLEVTSIGEHHSGVNAKSKKSKRRRRRRSRRRNRSSASPNSNNAVVVDTEDTSDANNAEITVPVVGDLVNDSLPVVESESRFSSDKYLMYSGGGERCKNMDHYMWSFLCALGEAQYLNRTLVMDLSICLNSMYTLSKQDEEGKDFRFYFDFEHLMETASVLDQRQFWTDWGLWEKKDNLKLHVIDDFRVEPMKLTSLNDASLIMRKFGSVEPDNYWYRVCEGETESVIQRPWNLLWKSPRLLEIVSAISSSLHWDFDSVHIVRGDKAKNTKLWPNLAADTSPEALLSRLGEKIEDGRNLFISTDETDISFFDPLKDKYTLHFVDDYKHVWGEDSEWYAETKQLNNGNPVEFDGYMKVEVSTEVFYRGKKQLETFNDLTSDCKDGVNTCKTSSA